MKLFLAIEVPDFTFLEERTQYKELKYVDEFHLSLKHLGECEKKEANEFKKRLDRVKHDSFIVKTQVHLGVFNNWENPKNIYVQIEQNKMLKLLVNKIENLLPEFVVDEFKPHITLARVTSDLSNEQKDRLQKMQLNAVEFAVERFHLVNSITKEVIKTYNL